jgi:hypothetical protein
MPHVENFMIEAFVLITAILLFWLLLGFFDSLNQEHRSWGLWEAPIYRRNPWTDLMA